MRTFEPRTVVPDDGDRNLHGWYGSGKLLDCLFAGGATLMAWATWIGLSSFIPTPAPQLLSAVLTVLLVLLGLWHLARRRSSVLGDHATFLAFALAASTLLVIFNVVWLSEPGEVDFQWYREAAAALLEDQSPYFLDGRESPYIYPPFLAHGLALARASLGPVSSIIGRGGISDDAFAWSVVFHAYQFAQYLWCMAFFAGLALFARRCGFPLAAAAALALLLAVVNISTIEVLAWKQVDIANACLMVWGMLLARRSPVGSGLLLAAALNLKIYSGLLFPVLLLSKEWRTAAWFAGFSVALILGQILLAGGLAPMADFVRMMGLVEARLPPLRDISLRNISVYGLLLRFPGERWLFRAMAGAFGLVIAALVVRRAVVRQRAASAGGYDPILGHFADASALMLIMSPLVWIQHYVIAAPVVIWSMATARGRTLLLIVLVATFIYLTPLSEYALLAALKPVGLIFLLLAVPAESEPQGFPAPDALGVTP